MGRSVDSGVVTFGAVVLGVLAVFWASAELQAVGIAVPVVRSAAGLFLLLFAPGALLSRLVGIRMDRFGRFALFSVALSFGVLTAINLFVSFVLAPIGFERPLSFVPLATVLSVVLAVLLSLTCLNGTTMSIPRVRLTGSVPVIFLLLFLPVLSAVAVGGVDQYGTNAGMFLFVCAVIAVALLAATRYVPSTLYPLTLFSVSVSVLLHRNLLTDHVVGADVQASYFISNLLLRTNHWTPDLGGSMMSLSAVTSVPAAITMLTGLELAITFKLVYVFLFSLVPVGLFYVTGRVFDDRVALFGSLFFVFYHGSFYFTPGKQLVSELSVVAILLLFAYWGVDTAGRKVVLVVLAVTLISSHYGMTYALGGALLAASVGLLAVQWAVGDFDHDLSPWYPVALLGLATAFYAYSAPALVDRLASIPFGIADQLLTLAVTGTIPGSGASYLEGATRPLDSLRTYLYVLLTALIGLGLTRDVVGKLFQIRNGESPAHVEYTALAVPFFVFLGSTYVVIPNLLADRVYQMTLVLLAPYVALGHRTVVEGAGTLLGRVDVPERAGDARDRIAGAQWSLLAVLLAALLALNSGMAFSLAGAADTSSFDGGANDLTFTAPEREAAGWIAANVSDIERYDRMRPDGAETVPIYTEPRSFQLFRAVALSAYTNVELRYLKSRWRPTLYSGEVDKGYVFLRERSIEDGANADELPPSSLSRAQVRNLSATRNVVYASESAHVLESNTSVAS
jgi:uncharacterized membrane protein